MSHLRWLDSDYILNRQLDKNGSVSYIDDWQSVCGSPINSHFLTCADHHDVPPSVIVWASRLSALHLLISEAFCAEKGNCQQRLYKRERKQKEAGSEMCNFHSARLMGEERRREKRGRERRAWRGWIFAGNKKKINLEIRRLLYIQHFYLIMYFSCICLI